MTQGASRAASSLPPSHGQEQKSVHSGLSGPGMVKPIGGLGSGSEKNTPIFLIVYILLIVFGVGTGYFLAGGSSGKTLVPGSTKPAAIKTQTAEGISDTQTFKDSADGTLETGGIDGEGTHKLVREGGPSQTAYLISSVVDLDSYIGKKVKVWGQTIAAKKAPWLMDVGKIELLQE